MVSRRFRSFACVSCNLVGGFLTCPESDPDRLDPVEGLPERLVLLLGTFCAIAGRGRDGGFVAGHLTTVWGLGGVWLGGGSLGGGGAPTELIELWRARYGLVIGEPGPREDKPGVEAGSVDIEFCRLRVVVGGVNEFGSRTDMFEGDMAGGRDIVLLCGESGVTVLPNNCPFNGPPGGAAGARRRGSSGRPGSVLTFGRCTACGTQFFPGRAPSSAPNAGGGGGARCRLRGKPLPGRSAPLRFFPNCGLPCPALGSLFG